jgi:hypothetical protein
MVTAYMTLKFGSYLGLILLHFLEDLLRGSPGWLDEACHRRLIGGLYVGLLVSLTCESLAHHPW